MEIVDIVRAYHDSLHKLAAVFGQEPSFMVGKNFESNITDYWFYRDSQLIIGSLNDIKNVINGGARNVTTTKYLNVGTHLVSSSPKGYHLYGGTVGGTSFSGPTFYILSDTKKVTATLEVKTNET